MSEIQDYDGTEVELILTMSVRYRVHAEHYNGAKTLEEAMAIDVQNAKDEPFLALSMGDGPEKLDLVTWKKV